MLQSWQRRDAAAEGEGGGKMLQGWQIRETVSKRYPLQKLSIGRHPLDGCGHLVRLTLSTRGYLEACEGINTIKKLAVHVSALVSVGTWSHFAEATVDAPTDASIAHDLLVCVAFGTSDLFSTESVVFVWIHGHSVDNVRNGFLPAVMEKSMSRWHGQTSDNSE
jgi:hypothetical protein